MVLRLQSIQLSKSNHFTADFRWKELGVRLLEKNTRYIRMTDQGERFFDYAIQVLGLTRCVQRITKAPERTSGKNGLPPTIFGELHLDYVLHEYTKLSRSLSKWSMVKIRNPLQKV